MAPIDHEFLSKMHEIYDANGNGNGGGNGNGSEKKLLRHKIRAAAQAKLRQFEDTTKEGRYQRGLAKRNGSKNGDKPQSPEK